MEKQIEEMAKLTCNSHRSCYGGECIGSNICAVRENCEKLYNAGYRKQEWISVEERLPEDSTNVLAYSKRYEIGMYYYSKDDEWWDNDGYASAKYYEITHWMPLPELPKGE